ncbi:cytochrome P450 2K1-like [Hemiscyllium ocellatum]|uniref:cytochrome P450 2K1-like n=1 Tax=Hemiscyllium ocellatum TaxID=170820 RepID=UPI002965F3E4|nr:cytochrome P450 2K1-like [Hemiscyllium ocellatum]
MALLKLFPTDYTLALSLLALFLFLVVSVFRLPSDYEAQSQSMMEYFPLAWMDIAPTPLRSLNCIQAANGMDLWLSGGQADGMQIVGHFAGIDNSTEMNLDRIGELGFKAEGILAEKYGNVFSVELGPLKAVVLTGYDAVKDALVNHADQFSGRPPIPIFDEISFRTERGVVFSDGKLWRENRKFVISALRGFGMGKKSVDDRISEEASFLVNVFESHKGQPFETARILNSAMSSIICSILFGDRFDYDDKIFNSLISMNNETARLAGAASIQVYNSYPSLGFLIPAHRKIIENRDKMMEIFDSFFKAAEETLSENSIQTLNEALILRHQQESRGQDAEVQKRNTLMIINDLFSAGTETTATTVCWGLLLMMKYPGIQRKVQEEIDQVIGAGRAPVTEDRKQMPYTEAVIHEIPRFANIVPMNLPHSTTEDTHVKGHFIPKGTYVIPVLTSVLCDKTQWKTPKEFNPAHFLDADGNFVKRDAFMPFSAGNWTRGTCIPVVKYFHF